MKAGRDLALGVKRMWPLAVIDFNRTAEPAVVVVDNEIGIAIPRADGFAAQRALGASSRANDKDRADGEQNGAQDWPNEDWTWIRLRREERGA